MVFSARAATKGVARNRRRRTCSYPRSSSTLPTLLATINEQGEMRQQRDSTAEHTKAIARVGRYLIFVSLRSSTTLQSPTVTERSVVSWVQPAAVCLRSRRVLSPKPSPATLSCVIDDARQRDAKAAAELGGELLSLVSEVVPPHCGRLGRRHYGGDVGDPVGALCVCDGCAALAQGARLSVGEVKTESSALA